MSRSVVSRRVSPRLLVAGAALLIPVLAGCEAGLDTGTASFHPVAFGGYVTATPNPDVSVTVNNAFILGPAPGQTLPAGSQAGLFLSIYSSSGDQLKSASTSAGPVRIDSAPVDIPANGVANLNAATPQLVLTGLTSPLAGGQTVTVDLVFANAGTVTMNVPVQPDAGQYTTYQPPAP